jgi:hypothetical protein
MNQVFNNTPFNNVYSTGKLDDSLYSRYLQKSLNTRPLNPPQGDFSKLNVLQVPLRGDAPEYP